MTTTKNPPHPGLTVKHDCVKELGLSIAGGQGAGRHAPGAQQYRERQERDFARDGRASCQGVRQLAGNLARHAVICMRWVNGEISIMSL
jgi:hypothetical protein